MIKNIVISFEEQKEESRGSVEFQVFSFTNKIRRLTSHLEIAQKRLLISAGSTKNSGKTSTTAGLFVKKK